MTQHEEAVRLAESIGAFVKPAVFGSPALITLSSPQLAALIAEVRRQAMEEAAAKSYAVADHYRDQGLTMFEDAARECGSAIRAKLEERK